MLSNFSVEEIAKLKARFQTHVFKSPTCWLWTGKQRSDGYGMMWIHGKRARAHRVAYELYIGDIPFNKIVCHDCDNPSCVNPAHLYSGTDATNAADREVKNRGNNSKLTYHDVDKIRDMSDSGVPRKKIAGLWGVTSSCIAKIVRYERWAPTKYMDTKTWTFQDV
jgi:hypothetical protein